MPANAMANRQSSIRDFSVVSHQSGVLKSKPTYGFCFKYIWIPSFHINKITIYSHIIYTVKHGRIQRIYTNIINSKFAYGKAKSFINMISAPKNIYPNLSNKTETVLFSNHPKINLSQKSN